MMGKSNAQVALATNDIEHAEPLGEDTEDQAIRRRPKLVVTLGRGKTGKSVWLRWVAETATRRRPLRIIDADPNNQALARHFKEAEVPPTVDGDEKRSWIEAQMNDMMDAAGDPTRRYDMLLDVGGNDQLLKRLGHEVQIAEVLEAEGVDPVAVHMLGPDDDDLRYLEDVENNNLFRPKATVLVVNAGLVPMTSDPKHAFRGVLSSEIVKRVTSPERGGRLVFMPALGCMREFESLGIRSFRAALRDDGPRRIGRLNCVRIRNWLERDMAGVRATLSDLLP
jgi:hypothetical protein